MSDMPSVLNAHMLMARILDPFGRGFGVIPEHTGRVLAEDEKTDYLFRVAIAAAVFNYTTHILATVTSPMVRLPQIRAVRTNVGLGGIRHHPADVLLLASMAKEARWQIDTALLADVPGHIITAIVPGGAAHLQGMEAGMIFDTVNGWKITSPSDLAAGLDERIVEVIVPQIEVEADMVDGPSTFGYPPFFPPAGRRTFRLPRDGSLGVHVKNVWPPIFNLLSKLQGRMVFEETTVQFFEELGLELGLDPA